MRPSLVRWDRHDGTQVQHWPLEGVSFSGSIHTVSQTRDWVILCDSGNFKADPDEMFGGERTVTDRRARSPVWLIRKEQVEGLPSGTPVTPTCFTMAPPTGHYYARWDDTDGVSVVWEGMDLMDLGLYLRPDDLDVNGNPIDPAVVGLYNMAMAPETITEVVFDPESATVSHVGHLQAGLGVQPPALGHGLEHRGHVGAHAAPRRPTRAVDPATSASGPRRCTRTASTWTCSGRRRPGRSARSTARAWS